MHAFRLAYDGTGYRGLQRQPYGGTVENALFEALEALDVAFEAGAPVGYTAAGRTDAGVSARAQTVAVEAPEWLRLSALNAELPADSGPGRPPTPAPTSTPPTRPPSGGTATTYAPPTRATTGLPRRAGACRVATTSTTSRHDRP